MLQTRCQRHPGSAASFIFHSLSPFPFLHSISFPFRPTNPNFVCSAQRKLVAQLSEQLTSVAITASSSEISVPEEGPIELSPSIPPIFATSDDPSPLQTATTVLLTGAITVFLFRSLRRRAKRAKEMRFRSSGAKKSLTEEAVESLKTVSLSPAIGKSQPSPVQTFLGALTAGVIALILYKFTTTIESSLNRQTISDNYSVRQITITIRTIINGICYLATFVFGVNALGLFLYSGQLAINSFMEGSSGEDEAPLGSSNSKSGDEDSFEMNSTLDQGSEDTKTKN